VRTSAPASDGFKDYDRWHCHGVTAVTSGEWMKYIVEMAAAVGAKRFKRRICLRPAD
jgi:hypothetical protein